MATLTFKNLPAGPVDLYEEARVEPYRQARQKPARAPVASGTVVAGSVSFTVPTRVPYVLWTGSEFRTGMVGITPLTTH